jgi:hypothetical protein
MYKLFVRLLHKQLPPRDSLLIASMAPVITGILHTRISINPEQLFNSICTFSSIPRHWLLIGPEFIHVSELAVNIVHLTSELAA